ncbi:MAG: hypothetical protein IPI66_12870 [Chitinophagaceae bacterium]|nr:hypothetical protein [Chitinophagaceae bacterium]MBL0056449.1 hypothetical protein [Chitinophagaceae bacterium]
MKKLFAILAIAGAMTACNSGEGDKPAATDSPKVETPVMDATKVADSANKMINNAADSASKMMDKAVDTAKKMVEKAAK